MPTPTPPRHAADVAPLAPDQAANGRHRRPESLADLRTGSHSDPRTEPSADPRKDALLDPRMESVFDPRMDALLDPRTQSPGKAPETHPADEAILAARRAAADLRASTHGPAIPPPARPSRVERRRQERSAGRREERTTERRRERTAGRAEERTTERRGDGTGGRRRSQREDEHGWTGSTAEWLQLRPAAAPAEPDRPAQAESPRPARPDSERLAWAEPERPRRAEPDRTARAEPERMAWAEPESSAWAESERLEQAEPQRPAPPMSGEAIPGEPISGAATRRASRGRHTAPRGRHARPSDPLDITVRPAAGRSAPGTRRPVVGSRRAPGTLPLESWLLVGKTRQQVLLASLVAAGMALVMIPVTQPDTPADPVTAAGQAAAHNDPAGAAKARPTDTKKPVRQKPKTEKDQPSATPETPVTEAPEAVAPTTAPAATGPSDGPSRSLRTTGTRTVALTFDDGPDPVQTPKILAMLAEYDVKATFCLVGVQVERHPEIVRDIVAAGHTLCNHTWDHSLTIGKDAPEAISADLAKTNQAIRAAAPDAPVPFFRAPGGNFSDRLVQVAREQGMTSLYWEVDPRDWEHKEKDDERHVDKVVQDVQASVRPGSIVLSHDFNQPDTIKAYEQLLPWLAEHFELGIPPVDAPA